MLKPTLVAAAAVSLLAVGATDAFAGKGGSRHGWEHHGSGHGGKYGGRRHGGHYKHGGHYEHGWYRYPNWWFNYSYPRCHYEPRKARIKVWDRHGRPYHKWVWKDVKVC